MSQFISIKDFVYDYISEEIRNNNLKSGEKVNENKIIEKFGISRTPVREALIQLSTEGYLENIPRRGFVIRKIEAKEAANTYEIIGLLDGYIAANVCGKLEEKDFQDMQFYAESANLAIKTGNYDAYYKQQNEFHNTYTKKFDNQALIDLLDRTKKKFLKSEYSLPDIEALEKELTETNTEHFKIIEMFRLEDCNKIEKFLREVHWNIQKSILETS